MGGWGENVHLFSLERKPNFSSLSSSFWHSKVEVSLDVFYCKHNLSERAPVIIKMDSNCPFFWTALLKRSNLKKKKPKKLLLVKWLHFCGILTSSGNLGWFKWNDCQNGLRREGQCILRTARKWGASSVEGPPKKPQEIRCHWSPITLVMRQRARRDVPRTSGGNRIE